MKSGVPPTLRNARTGEFTPPGMSRPARSNNSMLAGPAVVDWSGTHDSPQAASQASARAAAFAK
jgi:hypothetical protein